MFPYASRCFQMYPDAPKMIPKCFLMLPKMLPRCLRMPPPDASQMLPKCSQMPPRCAPARHHPAEHIISFSRSRLCVDLTVAILAQVSCHCPFSSWDGGLASRMAPKSSCKEWSFWSADEWQDVEEWRPHRWNGQWSSRKWKAAAAMDGPSSSSSDGWAEQQQQTIGRSQQPPPPPQQPKTKSQQPLPPMLLGRRLEIPSPDAGRKEESDPPAKTASPDDNGYYRWWAEQQQQQLQPRPPQGLFIERHALLDREVRLGLGKIPLEIERRGHDLVRMVNKAKPKVQDCATNAVQKWEKSETFAFEPYPFPEQDTVFAIRLKRNGAVDTLRRALGPKIIMDVGTPLGREGSFQPFVTNCGVPFLRIWVTNQASTKSPLSWAMVMNGSFEHCEEFQELRSSRARGTEKRHPFTVMEEWLPRPPIGSEI